MDPFDDIVGAMQVENLLHVRLHLLAPWGVMFNTRNHARLLIVTKGSAWLASADQPEPTPVSAGDCFIIRAGTSFTMMDEQGRSPVACETIFSEHTGHTIQHGGAGALTEIVSGIFSFDAAAAEPLMVLLPRLLHIKLEAEHASLLGLTLELMGRETAQDGVAAGLVVSRLADVLFVQALRAWSAAEGGRAVGWLAGMKDNRLAVVIRSMHGDLAHPWTVESLARQAGLSRSSFAATFKAVTGQAPLNYLTSWRMYRVRMLLLTSNLGLMEIAHRVGYDTDTALSRAFRRTEGVPPGEWRRKMRANQESHVPTIDDARPHSR